MPSKHPFTPLAQAFAEVTATAQTTVASIQAQGEATIADLQATVHQQGQALCDRGEATLNTLQAAAQDAAQATTTMLHDTLQQGQQSAQQVGLAIGVSGSLVGQVLQTLPQTAQELMIELPAIAARLQRAGLRDGWAGRSDAEIMALFNKIPGTSKLGGTEQGLQEFLANRHASHIYPHARGGRADAANLVWEIGADNVRRGAEVMTSQEQIFIRMVNAADSLVQNSGTIARLGLTATGTAILVQTLVTAMAYALDCYRGDLTGAEFRDRIVATAVQAGIATPIFFLLMMLAIALVPELVVILSAPAVVAAFQALFGVSVALPLIQSVIRHVQAVESAAAPRPQASPATP